MISRIDIITEARGYIGTPFRHQARSPGKALDCGGVVVCIAQALGLSGVYTDIRDYPRDPVSSWMTDLLDTYMDRIPVNRARPGDIIQIAWAKYPQHLAVLSGEDRIIHATQDAGQVVETTLSAWMRRMIRGAWKYKGVE